LDARMFLAIEKKEEIRTFGLSRLKLKRE